MLAAAATLLGCASSRSAGYAAGPGASCQESAALPGKPGCFWLRDFDGSWTVFNELSGRAPSLRSIRPVSPFGAPVRRVGVYPVQPVLDFGKLRLFSQPRYASCQDHGVSHSRWLSPLG
jgi:hypothetical protein